MDFDIKVKDTGNELDDKVMTLIEKDTEFIDVITFMDNEPENQKMASCYLMNKFYDKYNLLKIANIDSGEIQVADESDHIRCEFIRKSLNETYYNHIRVIDVIDICENNEYRVDHGDEIELVYCEKCGYIKKDDVKNHNPEHNIIPDFIPIEEINMMKKHKEENDWYNNYYPLLS
jgi:hypothetical protein